MAYIIYNDELYHHGIQGQKWGVRRFQNEDGSRTSLGKQRYGEVLTARQQNRLNQYKNRELVKGAIKFSNSKINKKINKADEKFEKTGKDKYLNKKEKLQKQAKENNIKRSINEKAIHNLTYSDMKKEVTKDVAKRTATVLAGVGLHVATGGGLVKTPYFNTGKAYTQRLFTPQGLQNVTYQPKARLGLTPIMSIGYNKEKARLKQYGYYNKK